MSLFNFGGPTERELASGPYVDALPTPLEPPARKRGPETSKAAARSKRKSAPSEARRIWTMIREAGGLTCDEIEERTAMLHQTTSARIRGMVKSGYLKASGQKRFTRSGRKAIVWYAKDRRP